MMNKKIIGISLIALICREAKAQEITIANKTIDCGQVVFKSPVRAEFEMRNSGERPLVITNVKTSCGCTQAQYPKAPIAPGAKFMVAAPTTPNKWAGSTNKLAYTATPPKIL